MSHLGPRATALADGQLPAVEAERALAHAAACERCASELAAARAMRAAVSSAPDVVPDAALTARLLAMTPPRRASEGDPVRCLTPGPAALGELSGRHAGPWVRAATAVAGAGGVLALGLFALGNGPLVTPNLHPADPLTVLGEADAAHGTVVVAASAEPDALSWMAANGWRTPGALPNGYAVQDVRLDAGGSVLEVDLAGMRTPETIVVREQQGRLDDDALAGVATKDFGGTTAYVVSRAPWHLVWQSGSTVIDVVADASEADVGELVSAFPSADYDSGIPARIGRGWTTMTGAIGIS